MGSGDRRQVHTTCTGLRHTPRLQRPEVLFLGHLHAGKGGVALEHAELAVADAHPPGDEPQLVHRALAGEKGLACAEENVGVAAQSSSAFLHAMKWPLRGMQECAKQRCSVVGLVLCCTSGPPT